jgi:hypothetical protein
MNFLNAIAKTKATYEAEVGHKPTHLILSDFHSRLLNAELETMASAKPSTEVNVTEVLGLKVVVLGKYAGLDFRWGFGYIPK